ncbi:MAG: IS21 family transposase [Cyanobacteria bacterium]|nr:IS21 family transposase [Cyanobacteriota bacterium]
MIEIKEILTRLANGHSIRSVSNTLGIHRDTIRSYLSLAKSFGFVKDNKDSITDDLVSKIRQCLFSSYNTNNLCPRERLLLPVKGKIEEYLEQGLKGSKIVMLLSRQGINVTSDSFYRFVKDNCGAYRRKNITVRLPETDPGDYAQADFGLLGRLFDSDAGKERAVHALVVTLCCSRHMFVYVTFKQDISAVIAGFESTWAYFGGVTKLVIVDNCRPVVKKPDRTDPVINRSFLEYAQARGFTPDPANIGHAKGKPIVERMIPYVRDNFFRGEKFISINDCNARAVAWCTNTAGTRIHGTTGKVPIIVFEETEKDRLVAFGYDRYDIAVWAVCKVHPDHHIRFGNSLYSLPTKYIGGRVDVRGDSALVKIYHNGALVKVHKTVEAGKRSTDFEDYPAELTPYTLRNPKYQISAGYAKSKAIGAFIEEILSGPYPWHRLRSAQKILRLADKYGPERTSAALEKAKAYSIYDMRRIENILKNGVENQYEVKQLMLHKPCQFKFLRETSSFNHYKT